MFIYIPFVTWDLISLMLWYYVLVIVKASKEQVMKTQHGDRKLGSNPDFDIQHNLDGRSVISMHWLYFTTKKTPWYSLLLDTEWTPSLMTCDCMLLNIYVRHLL
jgi:hypothetical protein